MAASIPSPLYDVVIIGAGPGGYHSAIRASRYGARVALIEKNEIGGSCVNLGCVPLNAFSASAKMIEKLSRGTERFGINFPAPFSIDFSRIVERKDAIVSASIRGIKRLLRNAEVHLFHGKGFVAGGTFETGYVVHVNIAPGIVKEIRGRRIIIATGSVPAKNPAFKIDHDKILTSDDILSPGFDRLPETMIIVGGGVIGCEFANIFARFGVKVTIIDIFETILANESAVAGEELKKEFDNLGITIHTNSYLQAIERTTRGVRAIIYKTPGSPDVITGLDGSRKMILESNTCLISIGRDRQSDMIGLESVGVKKEMDRIVVNQATCETDVRGIYAIGDVASTILLAQIAFHQGDVAIANALASIGSFHIKERFTDYFTIPYVIYTIPEIATVGMRESMAKDRYNTLTGTYRYKDLSLAACTGDNKGFMMIIANKENDRILGATCIGITAAEIIAEIAVAMHNNITVSRLVEVIHSHPTFSEMVVETLNDLLSGSIIGPSHAENT